MKTTVEIPHSLFEQARTLARQRGQSFKEIVALALRRFLKFHAQKQTSFRLKNASFKGKGLVDGLGEGDWDEIWRCAYEGRGG